MVILTDVESKVLGVQVWQKSDTNKILPSRSLPLVGSAPYEADGPEISLGGNVRLRDWRGELPELEAFILASHLPPLHAYSARDWPACESLNSVQLRANKLDQSGMGEVHVVAYMFLRVLEYERVAAENGGDKSLEFHVREALTYTRSINIIHERLSQVPQKQYGVESFHRPRPVRVWIESLLNPGLILLEPPFGPKHLDVVPPDLRIPMDGITRYAQNYTRREELPTDVQPTLRNETMEAHGGGRMQSKAFIDDSFEVRESLDDFRGCDRVVLVSECHVELFLEFRLDVGFRAR